MRNGCLILLSTLGFLACSGSRLHVGDDGPGGGHAGSGGTATGMGGNGAGGTTGAGGTGGSVGATGTGGAAGQAGGGDAGVGSGLSVTPSSATFASTLVEAVSPSRTFTVHNDGNATVATTAALAALEGINAADFLITSNGCGATLQPGASCDVAVAFAPKTRSGSRIASLTVNSTSGATTNVSLSGTALASLGLLAGGLGGPGNLNGPGAAVRFYGLGSIASDGAGNLYVSDNNTIRKVDVATGVVTTFAGAPGQPGSADGTGAAVRFNGPGDIASDGVGNLYITDGNTVRKVVIATGTVTTLAGAAGETGSADGTGAAARFAAPGGIVSDGAGSLYITDSCNSNTIRTVVIATGTVTTLAGTAGLEGSADGTGAAARFSCPGGIASDGAGNLYVTDYLNRTIRKIVIATRTVTTLAGAPGPDDSLDGTGTAARFVGPGGIVSDGAGNLYVTDTDAFGGVIRKIVIATATVTTFAGAAFQEGRLDGTGAAARFEPLGAIASDGTGNLYVTDSRGIGGSIRRVAIATAAVTTLVGASQQIGSADGMGPAARFNGPSGIAGDGAGNLYVADTYNSSVRKVVIATGGVTTLGGGAFYEPYAIATDGAGNVYVSDGGRLIRKIVVATGAVSTLAGAPDDPYPGYVDGVGTAARFNGVTGIVGDGAGNFYVADANNYCIRKVVMATGAVTTVAGAAGQPGVADGTGAAARFNYPRGIASDGAGSLFVADDSTIRRLVIATGAVTTIAGAAGQSGVADGTGAAARFNYPSSIASDGAGSLYVTEFNNTAVRKVAVASAIVSTVIGSVDRVGVSLGALPASVNRPRGVVVLPTGELAITDNAENAVLIGHL